MSAMLILAFDTTNERGGAGIFRDGKCLAVERSDGRANYSVLIFEMVERLLAETRLQLSEIDLFAVANGPGSFTGIRVGVAAAQGWATAFGRPVCGVSVLAAVVAQARPETEWAAPILDARRAEFYAGLFRRVPAAGAATYEAQGEGWISKPVQLAETLAQKLPAHAALTLLAREHDQAACNFSGNLPGAFHWQVVPGLLVSAIAGIALEANARGRLQSPAELDACYIRRTDAELHWQE
jgi:tRNA threonylcarbamoyladenosine biosynthesis protein TsaB